MTHNSIEVGISIEFMSFPWRFWWNFCENVYQMIAVINTKTIRICTQIRTPTTVDASKIMHNICYEYHYGAISINKSMYYPTNTLPKHSVHICCCLIRDRCFREEIEMLVYELSDVKKVTLVDYVYSQLILITVLTSPTAIDYINKITLTICVNISPLSIPNEKKMRIRSYPVASSVG